VWFLFNHVEYDACVYILDIKANKPFQEGSNPVYLAHLVNRLVLGPNGWLFFFVD